MKERKRRLEEGFNWEMKRENRGMVKMKKRYIRRENVVKIRIYKKIEVKKCLNS